MIKWLSQKHILIPSITFGAIARAGILTLAAIGIISQHIIIGIIIIGVASMDLITSYVAGHKLVYCYA